MKNGIVAVLLAATYLVVGCRTKTSVSSTMPTTGGRPVVVSDGGNTWLLGATTINSTNVSGTNVTVGVRTREVSK